MAPALSQLLAINTPQNRFIREIDNHYHAAMIAESQRHLVEYQRGLLNVQRQAAAANVRGLSGVAARQDATNSLLGSLLGGVDDLKASALETLDAVSAQTLVLDQGFDEIAKLLMSQQYTLSSIADTLSRPYDTAAQEVLAEATRALKSGMRTTGKEREAEYDDAMRLLAVILDNPIGARNYTAWFQVGWLAWKTDTDYPAAEEAFFNAARLSRDKGDLYHVSALRHMAHMQYLQGQLREAYDTIQRAVEISPEEHDVLYDAARYAATTGREQECISLLSRCIDIRPQTIVTMFSEEDFLC